MIKHDELRGVIAKMVIHNLIFAKMIGITQDGWCGKATVMTLQQLLTNLKYYFGAIDGSMGPKTVKAWQRRGYFKTFSVLHCVA